MTNLDVLVTWRGVNLDVADLTTSAATPQSLRDAARAVQDAAAWLVRDYLRAELDSALVALTADTNPAPATERLVISGAAARTPQPETDQNLVSPNVEPVGEEPVPGAMYICPDCGREFGRSQALGRHRQATHTLAVAPAPTPPPEPSPILCPDCGSGFTSPQGLGAHRRYVHAQHGTTRNPGAIGATDRPQGLTDLPPADSDDNPTDTDRCICWHIRHRHGAEGCHVGLCDCAEFVRAAADLGATA